jgi:hypothetical protein
VLSGSEERYGNAVEHSTHRIAIIRDEVRAFVNQKVLTMFGNQTSVELLGRRVTGAAAGLPHEDGERASGTNTRTQKGEPSSYPGHDTYPLTEVRI